MDKKDVVHKYDGIYSATFIPSVGEKKKDGPSAHYAKINQTEKDKYYMNHLYVKSKKS